jgi:bicarbonate transport system ATP-binding protein
MAALAAVNMSAVSSQLKQAKLGETAPQATTAAAVVSSPPSPQIAASSIAPNASPAPIAAASPAATAAASPAPTAAASPAPIAAASAAPIAAASAAPIAAASAAPIAAESAAPIAAAATAASSATANSATAPNAATSATSEISDQAELDAIGQQLYAQIDKNWSTIPTFTESLTYRVKVKENGEILKFDPTNKAAKDFVKETPLPILQIPAGATAGAEKTAEFQVTFSPTNGGVLQVKTGK